MEAVDESGTETKNLLQQDLEKRGLLYAFFSRWSPYIEEEDHHVDSCIFYNLRYKPGFSNAHRRIILVINLSMLSMLAIMPFWEYGVGENDYFMAEDDMCTGPVESIWGSSTNDTCLELKPGYAEEGWQITPVQGHVHRYGPTYQGLVVFHIFMGLWLNVACNTVLTLRLWRFCAKPGTWRVFAQCLHYYGVLWCWVAHLAVALPMSYIRMLTLGPKASNWVYSFGADFFYEFYWAVIIILLCLQRAFHDVSDQSWPVQAFLSALCRWGGLATLFCGSAKFIVLLIRPDIAAEGDNMYPIGTDMIVLGGMLVMGFEAAYSTLHFVVFRSNDSRVFSAGTLYFFSDLIFTINLTYRVAPDLTPPATFIVVLFFVAHTFVNVRYVHDRQEQTFLQATTMRGNNMPLW